MTRGKDKSYLDCFGYLTLLFALGCYNQGVAAERPVKMPSPKPSSTKKASGSSQSITSNAFQYQIAPLPPFVERQHELKEPVAQRKSTQSLDVLLIDRQISLLEREPVEYVHVALRALSSEGLKEVARIKVNFNPAYQRFALHAIRVIRDGKTTDRTRQVEMDLLRREQGLDRHYYEGEVTAVGLLSDIRVQDVVEVEYSVTGANPIFGGRYSTFMPMSFDSNVAAFHFRLQHPERRPMKVVAPSAYTVDRKVKGGVVTHSLLTQKLAIYSDDADRPRWFDPVQWIEVSEYDSWSDVERWALKLFEVKGDLSPGLQGLIDDWKRKNGDAKQKIADALRWVQSDIRYFGIELGVNSHLPVHPNLTFERRFGDCKDKSLLLATLLNGMGISAQPALVSLRFHRGVEGKQASPRAFDHVIVRVKLNEKVYWLDPALPTQYGSLDEIGDSDYGKALLIGPGKGELLDTAQPFSVNDVITVTDTYSVKAFSEPVVLISETIMRGSYAEGMRNAYAGLPKEEFSRNFQAGMQRTFPASKMNGELIVHDDRVKNEFKLIENYQLVDLFQYKQGWLRVDVLAISLLDMLKIPQVPVRSTPFSLPYPAEVRHMIAFEVPEHSLKTVPPPNVERNAYWTFHSSYKLEPKRLQRDLVASSRRDHVPAQEIASYIDSTQKLRRQAGFFFNLRVAELPESEKRSLNRAFGEYAEFGKTHSEAIKAEMDALYGIKQITWDIMSNKLTKAQKAGAYHDRAIFWDNTGNMNDAIRDINEAINLEPQNTRHRYAKGRILAFAGQFDQALETFTLAAQQDREEQAGAEDHKALGMTLYYLGRYREATERFTRAAQISGKEGAAFALFWRYLASRRAEGMTASQMDSALAQLSQSEWPQPIGAMLSGRLSPENLIELAKSDDPGIKRDQLCEAYFYIAQRLALEGRIQEAREFFEKTVSLKVLPYSEHRYALIELIRLGKSAN